MKLQTIALHNFGSYADAEIDLRQIATAVITGHNGAGKSTGVVDAPLWALFGKCRTGTDQMIRLGTDDMAVTLTFELNGQRYRVIRKRSLKTKAGKSDLELQVAQPLDSREENLTHGHGEMWQPVSGARLADTQEKILALLNADYELLTATGFLLQGHADRFSRATSAERKAILAQILRLDQYAELKTAANRAATVAKTKLDAKQQEAQALEGTDRVLETLRREQTSLAERRQRLAEELDQLDKERTVLMEAQARDLAALLALEAVPEQLRKATTRRDELKAKDAALVARRERLEKLVANRSVVEAKIQEEAAQKAELAGLQAEERRLTEEIDALAGQIREAQCRVGDGTELALKLSEQQQAVAAAVRAYQGETATLTQDRDAVQRRIDEAVRAYHQESQALASRIQTEKADIDAAVDSYLRETETMRQAVAADDNAVTLLGQVPCDAVLQGRCQFTLQAVQAKDRLLGSRPALAARLSDRVAIAEQVASEALALYRANLREESTRLTDPEAIAQVTVPELVGAHHALTARCAERLTDETAIAETVAPLPVAMVRQHEEALRAWTRLGWADRVARLSQDETVKKAERSANQTQQQSVQATLGKLAAYTVLLPELQAAERDLIQIRADLDAVTLDLAEVLKTIEDGTRQLTERQTLIARQAQTDSDPQETERRRAAQVAVDRGLVHQAGGLTEKIQQAELDLVRAQALAKELEVLAGDLRHYQILLDVYAVIPVLVLESSIPLLEQEANRILAKISTSGLRVSLETQKALKNRDGLAETLDIKVRDVYGERLLENYSGGERARVDLAVRIGLSKLLANRAGARLETLVVDEAFAAVDREGVEQLVECLPMLSQEFPLVLFVTHDEEFKSSVAQQIVVHKNGAGSTVEVLA